MIARLKSLVQRNLPAKIIALVVAVALWGVVMEDQNPLIENTYTLDVAVRNAPEGYRITSPKEKVKVRVRGARSTFVSIESSDMANFSAYVDLSGYEEGTHLIRPQIVLPQGLELLEQQPETLSYTLDAIIQKQVPIDLIVNGATAQGTAVARISQADRNVSVIGPRSFVDKVSRAIGYVGLSGNDADFTLKVPLTAISDEGREVPNIRMAPESTTVDVQLARGLSKKIISVKAVLDSNLPEGYAVKDVRVDPLKIEVAGDENVTKALASVATEKISLDGMTKSFSRTVKLDLPAGITVTNPSVNVTIDIEKKSKDGVDEEK